MPDYIKVDIEKYRKDRQLENINLVFEHIYKAHKTIESSDSVNVNALQRVYEYIGREEVIQKSKNDEAFAKLVALYCCKSSSRQGSNDETYILDTLKKFMSSIGMKFEKSNINSLIPIKSGNFAGQLLHRDDVNKNNISKTECLKSIDCLVIEDLTIIGYGTLKVCFGAGGHQDNVLDEITQFCDWSQIQIQTQNNNQKVYIVLYDSVNTSKLFNDIKKKYKNINLLLTDSKNFKKDFLDWFNNNYKK